MEQIKLAQEWMVKTLVSLGFGQLDAEIYAFLSLNGSQKASAIAEAMRTCKRRVYRALENLKKRKIVLGTENPRVHFVAIPFDRLLDLLEKENLQEARQIEQNKDCLVELWNSYSEK